MISSEELRSLVGCLSTALSELESRVLSLYLDGYSYEQVGERLSCDTKTVDNALQRVKRKVGAHLRVARRRRLSAPPGAPGAAPARVAGGSGTHARGRPVGTATSAVEVASAGLSGASPGAARLQRVAATPGGAGVTSTGNVAARRRLVDRVAGTLTRYTCLPEPNTKCVIE